MKNSSIKYSIILNFIIAIIVSAILTVILSFSSIFILQFISSNLYIEFVELYNTNMVFMFKVLLFIFLLFLVLMFYIFIRRMNYITDYIEEISFNVKMVANGILDISIPIRSNNELGILASDINKMSYEIKGLMEKEREWDKHKNNLITNLSHDLRTPLTSVIGFLDIIEKNKYKNESELKHYSDIALLKAKQLKNSVDKLFEFTKLSNRDVKLNKIELNIKELIEQVIIGFIPLLEINNMEYRIFSESKNIKVLADSELLVRAFENIITNSIKYGSEGKCLDIKIEKKNIKTSIKFINYGDKIEETDLENLFERLYREEKKCEKHDGNGLGLAIVKTIVDIHEGVIKASSSDEKTVFEIVL